MPGVSWGRGLNIGSGDSAFNGPALPLPWELREAEQLCPSTFWRLI
jgi:hypothetical protein